MMVAMHHMLNGKLSPMKTTAMKQLPIALILACAATAGFAANPAVAADSKTETCIDDWSEATKIVKQEKLATVEELARGAKRALGGAIVRTALCRNDGRYVYNLVIRKSGGELSRARVDARKPF